MSLCSFLLHADDTARDLRATATGGSDCMVLCVLMANYAASNDRAFTRTCNEIIRVTSHNARVKRRSSSLTVAADIPCVGDVDILLVRQIFSVSHVRHEQGCRDGQTDEYRCMAYRSLFINVSTTMPREPINAKMYG